jgi:signal transduction histidine kinase/ActR/RegA family two-component response regulator
MAGLDVSVFELDRGRAALQKYGAANHLTVEIYGTDGCSVTGAVNPTPLFDLVSSGHGPYMFETCARQCLGQPALSPLVVVQEQYGVAVVGTPLVLAGTIVGAAVAGYVLTTHVSHREVERLARDCGLPFTDVWAVARRELPVPRPLLPLRGELLGIIANTLLSEQHRARQLEVTSLRLAEAAEAKDKFLAVLSHELRTPLTAILGYAALIRRRQLDEAGTGKALEVIERNAVLQSRLIDDLLDVSRIISGSLRVDLQPLALGVVIEAAVASARPTLYAKLLRVEVVLDAAASPVCGDPKRVQQIVSNLLVNAIKFTPAGGTITVRLVQQGAQVQILVEDTGIGIRPQFLPYVFDRFRQDDTTEARAHGGLGLGLAIVQHLVGLHDGTVTAESRGEGRGATFTVSLPAMVDAEASVEPVLVKAEDIADLAAFTLRGLRILVVDDDADVREVFTRMLELRNAQVTAVGTAEAALAALGHWKPDVLVSDIGMPGENGYSLMRTIRRLAPEHGGNIPALAVTAYASADDVKLALSAGFQAHRSKPIEPAELALAVGDLARGVLSDAR